MEGMEGRIIIVYIIIIMTISLLLLLLLSLNDYTSNILIMRYKRKAGREDEEESLR